MNKKPELELTEGSTYKIISMGSRDNALESMGVFKGFISIGIDEIGLIMELDKSHGEMKGKIRIIPLHVILAIDVYDIKPNDKEDMDKEAPHYVG